MGIQFFTKRLEQSWTLCKHHRVTVTKGGVAGVTVVDPKYFHRVLALPLDCQLILRNVTTSWPPSEPATQVWSMGQQQYQS